MLHIRRHWGGKLHTLPGDRMRKADLMRVQRLSVDQLLIRVIQIIADQRIAQIFEMHADLMRPARLQHKRKQAVSVSLRYHTVMRYRSVSVFKIYHTLQARAFFPSDRRIDHTGGRRYLAFYDRIIFSADPLCLLSLQGFCRNLLPQDRTAYHMLCHDRKPGCISVQPVDTSKYKGRIFLPEIPRQRIAQ